MVTPKFSFADFGAVEGIPTDLVQLLELESVNNHSESLDLATMSSGSDPITLASVTPHQQSEISLTDSSQIGKCQECQECDHKGSTYHSPTKEEIASNRALSVKRRKNTLAARKYRQKNLEEKQLLAQKVTELEKQLDVARLEAKWWQMEADRWKQTALSNSK